MKKAFYSLLILLLFCSSCKVYHEAQTEQSRYDLNSNSEVRADDDINEIIAPYKKELDAEMNKVIGTCEKELFKSLPECGLGNWAADAIFEQCNKTQEIPIDFAVVNYGGIRIPSLPKGDITTGKIFELMPFDNMMVILEVKGDIVQQLFENIAGRGGWPVSKGIVCDFNKGGELLKVNINGKPLDQNKIYRIGLTDYVANGGDKCHFFKGEKQIATDVLYRDAFMQQVIDLSEKGLNVDGEVDGRMNVVD